MRALVKKSGSPGLVLMEAPTPEPGPRDVVIRVEKAGVCGTDLHIYEWDAWAKGRVKPGTVIGHEFMGRVAKIGDAVTSVAVGARVSGEGHIGCGSCYSCRTGDGHICSDLRIIGIDVDGCFADYVKIPEQNVWALPDEVPDDVGAIFDPLGNAVHTVMRGVVSGRSVLVVGAGAIGLMIVGVARAAGAVDIAAADPNPLKRKLALQMGADFVCDPGEPGFEARLRARTRGGRGYDVVLEASGNPRGIQSGISLLRSGGWAALLGIPDREVSLDLARQVVFKGITIHGVTGRRMFATWYQVEDLLIHKRLDVRPVITHQLPLAEYERAFELMRSGEAVKVILDIEGGAHE